MSSLAQKQNKKKDKHILMSVPWKKETDTGLKLHEGEKMMTEYIFFVCICKLSLLNYLRPCAGVNGME